MANIVFFVARPIITFALVASFSVFFMHLFVIAGLLATKIERDVTERQDEFNNLGGYATAAFGGLLTGCLAIVAMVFIK